jgi:uncharacterized protein (TIGR03437 family)
MRPPADYLWQVDPFALSGGGSGIVETARIDYILPYWMGRYYGVIQSIALQSSAAAGVSVAANSLATMYGMNLASGVALADRQPLSTMLDNVTAIVTDSAGAQRNVPLVYVSPNQINFLVPDGTAAGAARFVVSNGSTTQTVTATIQTVAPGLFSMNGNGMGVAAATAISTPVGNPGSQTPVTVFQCGTSGCASVPIALSTSRNVYVSLYGTGIRNYSSLANLNVTVNGTSVPVLFAGAAVGYTGLDQINIGLPLSLAGSGESNVVVTVDGQKSNTVTLKIQ